MKDLIKILEILRDYYQGYTMLGSFTDKTPFQILIATALSARSKDSVTMVVVKKLFKEYPTAEKLAEAPLARVEKLVKSTGFYRIKAKRIIDISKALLETYDGKVPKGMDELVDLPGVGRKTAGCVLVYAFDKPAIPVDTHVQKISNRLGWVKTKKPEDTEQVLMKIVPRKYWKLVNEVLVLHGQNICKPISPMCDQCPVRIYCKRVGLK
jgi:endonuclease III